MYRASRYTQQTALLLRSGQVNVVIGGGEINILVQNDKDDDIQEDRPPDA